MKKLFERKEMKYKLTPAQAEQLINLLESWLVEDVYPEYDICSLYFDDEDFNLFRKSLDKPCYKEKLRLRSYGICHSMDDPVFLEIKKKFNGVVYKRRMDLSLSDAMHFAGRSAGSDGYVGSDDCAVSDGSIGSDGCLDSDFCSSSETNRVTNKEIASFFDQKNVSPKIFVSYHRKAFTWIDDPDLRITFDTDLRCRFTDLDLSVDSKGEPLFEDDPVILEIKSTVNFPILLVRALKELNIQNCSVSKAGTAYKKLIERNLNVGFA